MLCVAGYDPTGGAGVLADIAALAAIGVRGAGVLTALTRQRPDGPVTMQPLPPDEVARSLRELARDLQPAAVKIGMLASVDTARAVAEALGELPAGCPVVLDPVLAAGAGGDLAGSTMAQAIVAELLSRVTLITPNLAEAARLTGVAVHCEADMLAAAHWLRQKGARHVLVKGGHLPGEPVDVLVGPDGERRWTDGRIAHEREVHGTGCTLSSLIAGQLALGADVVAAVEAARQRLRGGIERAWPPASRGWLFLGSLSV